MLPVLGAGHDYPGIFIKHLFHHINNIGIAAVANDSEMHGHIDLVPLFHRYPFRQEPPFPFQKFLPGDPRPRKLQCYGLDLHPRLKNLHNIAQQNIRHQDPLFRDNTYKALHLQNTDRFSDGSPAESQCLCQLRLVEHTARPIFTVNDLLL